MNLYGYGKWWEEHWRGMPEFDQRDLAPWHSIEMAFQREEDLAEFERRISQDVPDYSRRTSSIWFPEAEIGRFANKRYVGGGETLPRWPIYVPTKGRWETRYTLKALDSIGVPYRAVVEAHEVDAYLSAGVSAEKLLVQPSHNRGLVVTRNWIWDHAEASGVRRFWTMDDNIQGFYRLNRNLKTPVADGAMLRAIEDFVDRYENVPIAGMNYFMFASRKSEVPPLTLNTRVYSNMLIETHALDVTGRPLRNEGFYNDDTDLCLRVLKSGRATVLFNAFLIFKSTTMTVKGGMTGHYVKQSGAFAEWLPLAKEWLAACAAANEHQAASPEELVEDGRWRMAAELWKKHRDVTKITRKWGRWQHSVDYSAFRKNKLIMRPDVEVREEVNDFGMTLHVDGEPECVSA